MREKVTVNFIRHDPLIMKPVNVLESLGGGTKVECGKYVWRVGAVLSDEQVDTILEQTTGYHVNIKDAKKGAAR